MEFYNIFTVHPLIFVSSMSVDEVNFDPASSIKNKNFYHYKFYFFIKFEFESDF